MLPLPCKPVKGSVDRSRQRGFEKELRKLGRLAFTGPKPNGPLA